MTEVSKVIEAFKSVRLRGNLVVAVPLNPSDMEIPEKDSTGFGLEGKSSKSEEDIRFVVVRVGPGEHQHGVLVPLDISAGDIFVTEFTNKSMRLIWKDAPRLLNGYKVVVGEARTMSSQHGLVAAIVGRVSEEP